MNSIELEDIVSQIDHIGLDMYQLMTELFPICRSITGNGVRDTLNQIKNHIDLKIHEIPSNTSVFDWTIPKEWNIVDAYVIDPLGNKVIDFKKSNLHVVSYSTSIRQKMTLEELKTHLHTLPNQPDTIPYLTSYYNENWGFCLSYNDFLKLEDGEYQVVIDSSLKDGSLTYGEYFIPGKNSDEILISCYVCHPSMCNDNLSGVVLATILAKHISKLSLDYSFRFLFIPETIGAITWLAINEKNISKIKHGLVATCVGDPGISTYKKSRQNNADIDKTVEFILKNSNSEYKIVDFFPSGSDERQFCSPGFNLPVGSLMRTPYGKFSQYHTSEDNLDFVGAHYLADSYVKYINTIFVLENNKKFVNLNPKCEPQLGKRGLYRQIGGQKLSQDSEMAIFWMLNFSDDEHSILDISEKSGIKFEILVDAALKLQQNNLIREAKGNK